MFPLRDVDRSGYEDLDEHGMFYVISIKLLTLLVCQLLRNKGRNYHLTRTYTNSTVGDAFDRECHRNVSKRCYKVYKFGILDIDRCRGLSLVLLNRLLSS